MEATPPKYPIKMEEKGGIAKDPWQPRPGEVRVGDYFISCDGGFKNIKVISNPSQSGTELINYFLYPLYTYFIFLHSFAPPPSTDVMRFTLPIAKKEKGKKINGKKKRKKKRKKSRKINNRRRGFTPKKKREGSDRMDGIARVTTNYTYLFLHFFYSFASFLDGSHAAQISDKNGRKRWYFEDPKFSEKIATKKHWSGPAKTFTAASTYANGIKRTQGISKYAHWSQLGVCAAACPLFPNVWRRERKWHSERSRNK